MKRIVTALVVLALLAVLVVVATRDVPVEVETREVAETLQAIGIHYGQGFWLHKPCPLRDLETDSRKADALPHIRRLQEAGAQPDSENSSRRQRATDG